MLLRVLTRRVRSRREALNALLLAVFPHLKILSGQIVDVVPFLVGNDSINENQFGFGVDDGSRISRGLRADQRDKTAQPQQRRQILYAPKIHDRTSNWVNQGISTTPLRAAMVCPSESRTTRRTT